MVAGVGLVNRFRSDTGSRSKQERYRAQLARYAQALAHAEPAMLGLYFPLLAGWREWGA